MTQYEKLLKKFLENPESINLRGLQTILNKNGFVIRKTKGSHIIYTNSNGIMFTIPIHNNDCKNIYKIKVKNTLFNNN